MDPPMFGVFDGASQQSQGLAHSPATSPAATIEGLSSTIAGTVPRQPRERLNRSSVSAIQENRAVMEKAQALQKIIQSSYTRAFRKRFIFLDMDNIIFSIRNSHLYQHGPGALQPEHVRLDITAFTAHVHGPDESKVEYMKAYYDDTHDRLANEFQSHGWVVTKQMQHGLLTKKIHCPARSEALRKTLVLVTGDGSANESSSSFVRLVERDLQDNSYLEVHSWLHSLSSHYTDLQRAYPRHVVVNPLNVPPAIIYSYATGRLPSRQDIADPLNVCPGEPAAG